MDDFRTAFARGAEVAPECVTHWVNELGGLQFALRGETFGLVSNEFTQLSDAEALGRDAAEYLRNHE